MDTHAHVSEGQDEAREEERALRGLDSGDETLNPQTKKTEESNNGMKMKAGFSVVSFEVRNSWFWGCGWLCLCPLDVGTLVSRLLKNVRAEMPQMGV